MFNGAVDQPPRGRTVLIVEDDEGFGESVAAFIESWGNQAVRVNRPDDAILRQQLGDHIHGVAVVSRDDIVALRYALLVEHLMPGIRLIVTIFDRTVAAEVTRTVPNCTVLAMTDAIVPSLLAGCLSPDLASVQRVGGQLLATTHDAAVVSLDHPPKHRRPTPHARPPRLVSWIKSLDASARALVLSSAGLVLALAADSALGVSTLAEPWPDAVWQAARVLTTVGSSAAAEHGPAWYKLVSTGLMLAVLALSGLFTAGLIDRITGRRLTSMLGIRAIPRRDHVIVVGLGQVGLRLCSELRALGIKVVAVERDRNARCLPLARAARIPVVLGRGGDRFLQQRLAVSEARALAAVSSDGLENIAVAVATRAIAPHQQIVLRAGGDDVTAESQSLFRIGTVCDVTRIAGALVASRALGLAPLSIFAIRHRMCALFSGGLVVDLDTWTAQALETRPETDTVRTRYASQRTHHPTDAATQPESATSPKLTTR